MSNYSFQYKEYYEGLKKKHNISNSKSKISYDEDIPIYRGSTVYSKNRRNKNESFISNLLMMQLVGTMMLFLFAFGGKYSTNDDIRQYYTKFKYGIEQEYTYANANVNSKEIKIESIKNKFLESIDWIKEKLINGDFTY